MVVVRAVRLGLRVTTTPIRLGHADGRGTSHYRPVLDSLRIARACCAHVFIGESSRRDAPSRSSRRLSVLARTPRSMHRSSGPHASPARTLSRHRRVLVPASRTGASRRPPSWTEWISVPVFGGLLLPGAWPHPRRAGRQPRASARTGRRLESLRRSFRTIWAFSWCFTERYRLAGEPRTLQRRGRRRGALAPGHGRCGRHDPLDRAPRSVGNGDGFRRVELTAPGPHRARERNRSARAAIRRGTDLAAPTTPTSHTFAGQDLGLAVKLATALRDGDVVALQGDRPREGGRTVTVSLFGRPMALPTGPAALARAATRHRFCPSSTFETVGSGSAPSMRPPIRRRAHRGP